MRPSLRQQIALLGAAVLVVLAGTVVAIVSTLRHTESAILRAEGARLTESARALASEYRDRLGALPAAPRSRDEDLARITSAVLGREPGVEGGYFDRRASELLGYAFPSHPGPKPKSDVPPAERSVILDVAQRGANSDTVVAYTLTGRVDIVLFRAASVRTANGIAGSAWIMKRLPGLRLESRTRTSWLGLLLAGSALACVVLAFLIARNLQRGVLKIERGLVSLESDLGARIPADDDQREVARIGAAVNRLADTLQSNLERERITDRRLRQVERLAALGRVAAGVAHEVRNPLATMRLRAQMIRTDDSRTAERSATVIIAEIDRLDALVSRLLTFARPATTSLRPLDLASLVDRRIEWFQHRAAGERVAMLRPPVQPPVMVLADPGSLAQVIDNVIQNALDALEVRDGGRVEVRLIPPTPPTSRMVRLEIRDSGPGITAEILDQVFEPFFTTKPRGTGLGLAISRELIRAQEGDMEIRSLPGEGTTVSIFLREANGAT